MDQQTIENHIKGLSKVEFDEVARLILRNVFSLDALDVDGKGDGGSDYLIFSKSSLLTAVAIQKTVQDKAWDTKVISDAKRAKEKLGASRFIFLTSRSRERQMFQKLQNEIFESTGMASEFYGAKEISAMIHEHNLLQEFAHAIRLPLDIETKTRPDNTQMMLHTYFALSEDRHRLNSAVIDSGLLFCLQDSPLGKEREALVNDCVSFLGLGHSRKQNVWSRVDALMVGGKIEKGGSVLRLTQKSQTELKVANGIYEEELTDLSIALVDLVSQSGGSWDQSSAYEATLHLAKMFVRQQLEVVNTLSAMSVLSDFWRTFENADHQLKTLLVGRGVKTVELDRLILQMVQLAKNNSLIQKLTTSVVYVALENVNTRKTSLVLGASKWKDVTVIVDTSVAIPYVTSSLFATSNGRFSQGSNSALKSLRALGARLAIPNVYLNECASHLVRAKDYCGNMPEFESSYSHSTNGYVAHYYQLREANMNVPGTLAEYIRQLAPSALDNSTDKSGAIRQVMQELRPLFSNYAVEFEDIEMPIHNYRKTIEEAYMYQLEKSSREKREILIDHDVTVLAHIRRCYSERSATILALTWDGVMLSVGKGLGNEWWILTPVEANDLVQTTAGLTDKNLMALAHGIASTIERSADLGARVIDRTIQFAGEKLADWEFRAKTAKFRDDALSRIDSGKATFNLSKFDAETDKFLTEQGVTVKRAT